MPDDSSRIGGAERAAIFLLSLGDDVASEVLKHMSPKEVQKLGVAMASQRNVTSEQVDHVMEDFVTTVARQTSIGVGSEDYIRNMLVKALGNDKAEGMIDRVLHGANTRGLEALKWMDPRAVADIISQEHPQIIAIVLSYLDPDQSAEVLALLNEKLALDVVLRMASLDGIQPTALNELNEVLEKNFSNANTTKSSRVGGVKTAANILNLLDASIENRLIESIKGVDENLAQEIQDLMFVFDDLSGVDDRSMQTLLREVSSESLIVALKGADDTVKEKVFSNMSKRASEMLRDDLEVRGPVKVSEVEGAQKEILAIARRLAEAGEISLGGGGGEDYV
jgi:flagellar motor switch protein FliG